MLAGGQPQGLQGLIGWHVRGGVAGGEGGVREEDVGCWWFRDERFERILECSKLWAVRVGIVERV